ncbi:MAG: SRPBCC family protein [Actinobacteria bacterium]|nr:SRPBCC family protein [Actinomycetota bacterium]
MSGEPTTDQYGVLDRSGERSQVRFVRRLRHAPEKVWRALTEPEHVSAWFPTDIVGERAPGADLTFPFRANEGPTMSGRYTAFDPPSTLEIVWGDDVLRFELQPDGDGTQLTMTVVLEELGKAARDGAGWHACLDALAADLDGTQAQTPEDGWRQVNKEYIERFGPEASKIGPPQKWIDAHGEP